MSCAGCAASVEDVLTAAEGVKSASVNYASYQVTIDYDESKTDLKLLREMVKNAGYDLALEELEMSEEQLEEKEQADYKVTQRNVVGSGIFAIPVFLLGMFFMNFPYSEIISFVLTTPVLFYFGREFFVNAYRQLKIGKTNMDSLVALSTGTAYLYSSFNTFFPSFLEARGMEAHIYFEAAAVIVFFILLGRLLEKRAKSGTTEAIKKLMGMQAKEVKLIEDGKTVSIPIDQVAVDQLILIKPGAKVPVDGVVESGTSYIDESTISGESMPVKKQENDRVYAGTLNQKGALHVRVKKVGKNTTLGQIIKMVSEAQGTKAPVQQLVDRIAAVFVPVVIAIAFISFGLWYVLGGDESLLMAVTAFITVLVIACPCALGLATPTALMVGIGQGAKNGILVKDAAGLQALQEADVVILDKTGTLTEGRPRLTDSWKDEMSIGEEDLACWKALEEYSEHPLAKMIVKELAHVEASSRIEDFQAITGKGISGLKEDKLYWVGNARLMEDQGVIVPEELKNIIKDWQSENRAFLFFGVGDEVRMSYAFRDEPKDGLQATLASLKKEGLEVVMATGDSKSMAQVIAQELAIDEWHGEMLPSDKANLVKSFQEKGKKVAMVGDGINDSEALASADVSIAMGEGADIAIDVADITILKSDINRLVAARQLAKNTQRIIKQNLFWAFIYNVLGIPIAAGLLYPFFGFLLNPMLAGAAMALSSVSVVTNSLRLKAK
ncbi:MAG: copper-translocating P-type ATPase [Cyclobacteriaceae bacterium]|nr:copper-translocating P-type ATPase [Cyclobacteriaceae bacterium]